MYGCLESDERREKQKDLPFTSLAGTLKERSNDFLTPLSLTASHFSTGTELI